MRSPLRPFSRVSKDVRSFVVLNLEPEDYAAALPALRDVGVFGDRALYVYRGEPLDPPMRRVALSRMAFSQLEAQAGELLARRFCYLSQAEERPADHAETAPIWSYGWQRVDGEWVCDGFDHSPLVTDQDGECPHCGAHIASNHKETECPRCGCTVYLT